MTIDNEDWAQIKALFEQAMVLPAAARADFIDQQVDARSLVRETVLSMLEHSFPADTPADRGFSEKPTTPHHVSDAPSLEPDLDPSERRTVARPTDRSRIVNSKLRPGMLVEHFQLLRVLGKGGMGSVYLAEQFVPIRRYVALKVVREGFISETGLRRFEAERQSLALMEHPSIAHVLEAGTLPDGNPYFAMEFIDGQTLTDYCDSKQLTIRERVKLFTSVVEAVQHAHQKGVIHRDLKPSNIMVRERDGVAQAKIIDFGIAKAVSDDVGLSSEAITVQNAMVGTPAYMSPEQASGQPIDIRTDVYALCMVLYELLAGSLPFDPKSLDSGNPFQNLYVIHSGEIQAPSSRLTRQASSKASIIAERRCTTPGELAKLLRSDLDWVILKGLDPDREQRYAAASNLVQDLWNYLDDQPVSARPAQRLYTLRKFVRRNRGIVFASCLALLAVIAGITAGAIGYIQALQANQIAMREKDKAEAINTFLIDMLNAANPHGGDREIKVVDVIDEAAESLSDQFDDRPEVKASLYHSLVKTFDSLGQYQKAEDLANKGLLWGAPILGETSETMLELRNLRGEAIGGASRYEEAKADYRFILEATDTEAGRDLPIRYTAFNNLGVMNAYTNNIDEGCDMMQECYRGRVRILGPHHERTIGAMGNWAACLLYAGKVEKALPVLEDMLEAKRDLHGLAHPSTLVTMENLANAYEKVGKIGAAIRLFQTNYDQILEVFGESHDRVTIAGNQYGRLLTRLGYLTRAEQVFQQVLSSWQTPTTIDIEYRFRAVQNYAELLADLDKPQKAWQVLDDFEASIQGVDEENTILARQRAFRMVQAGILSQLGRGAEAAQYAGKVFNLSYSSDDELRDQMDAYFTYAKQTRFHDPEGALTYINRGLALGDEDNYDRRALLSMKADVLVSLGRYAEALESADTLLEYWETHPKYEDYMLTLRVLNAKAKSLTALKHNQDSFFERHLRELSQTFGPDSPVSAVFEYQYTRYLMAHQQWRLAEKHLKNSLPLLQETHGKAHPIAQRAQADVAVVYEQLGTSTSSDKAEELRN